MTRAHLPQVLLVYFLVLTAFAAFEATFALYAERQFAFTTVTIGYMFAWVGVVLATVQGMLVGRVVRRVGEARLVPAAIFIISSALLLVAFAGSVPALAAAAGLLALGMGFNSPSMLSAISQLAHPADRGSTLGVSQSLGSLARILGPAWGGWAFDHFGIRTPFFTAAALMIVACTISIAAFRHFEPSAHGEMESPQLGSG
jgi:MFS family permease